MIAAIPEIESEHNERRTSRPYSKIPHSLLMRSNKMHQRGFPRSCFSLDPVHSRSILQPPCVVVVWCPNAFTSFLVIWVPEAFFEYPFKGFLMRSGYCIEAGMDGSK